MLTIRERLRDLDVPLLAGDAHADAPVRWVHYCHRHTLRYRIRKIEELTDRDLGNARDQIEFWLALRGREMVG